MPEDLALRGVTLSATVEQLMAVVERLSAEFPDHTLTVLRIVADSGARCPEGDATLVEQNARMHLLFLLGPAASEESAS